VNRNSRPSLTSAWAALALDLGTSRIKAGALTGNEKLVVLESRPAPQVSGSGWIRESDPEAYLKTASDVLRHVHDNTPELPIGLATQRSTFLLWESSTGKPVTPLISWQDRRAEPWCAARTEPATYWHDLTGLVLSAHYVGPKLATLLDNDSRLRRKMERGELLFGTLDTYLIWRWTGGRVYQTDLTMAARTLMVALGGEAWDDGLLQTFGIPKTGLPNIGASRGLDIALAGGRRIRAMLADQTAGLMALPLDQDSALVNLGTGGFVLLPTANPRIVPGEYLVSPLFGLESSDLSTVEMVVLEGTINGIGPVLESVKGEAGTLAEDRFPDAFCLPDAAGTGAPHWRSELGPVWSRNLPQEARYRIMLEGIVFRVNEIITGMTGKNRPGNLILAGGIAADEPLLGPALAACSGIPVERLLEPEASLMGAARIAAGLPPGGAQSEPVVFEGGDYLADKYLRWRKWLEGVLEN